MNLGSQMNPAANEPRHESLESLRHESLRPRPPFRCRSAAAGAWAPTDVTYGERRPARAADAVVPVAWVEATFQG